MKGRTSGELNTDANAVPTASVDIIDRSTPLAITTMAIPALNMPNIETVLMRVKIFPVVKNLSRNMENSRNMPIVTPKITAS